MSVSIIIILIYMSFFPDFFIWPIGSEASTQSLSQDVGFLKKLALWIVFAISLLGYIAPLLMAVYSLQEDIFNSLTLTSIFGVGVAVAGRIITSIGALNLKSSLSELHTTAIFSISRNPISLGMHLTFMGLIIICKEWWLVVPFVFYTVNIDLKINLEEKALVRKFGRAYVDYQSKTPKYLLV